MNDHYTLSRLALKQPECQRLTDAPKQASELSCPSSSGRVAPFGCVKSPSSRPKLQLITIRMLYPTAITEAGYHPATIQAKRGVLQVASHIHEPILVNRTSG